MEDERAYNENLGIRIATARGSLSQVEFADLLSISKNTILRYEKGYSVPDVVTVRKICDAAKVSLEWLVSGEGPMRPGDVQEQAACPACQVKEVAADPQPYTIDENGQVRIPRWQNPDPDMFDYVPMAEAKLSAGGGCFVISEDIEGYYAFRKNWLRRVSSSPSNMVLMRIAGDSMAPTIQEDDTVMIDIGRRDIRDGMIYALRVDSTVMIKRLSFRIGGKVLIISDNRAEYDAYEANVKDLHVIGQVIFFCRTLVPE